MHMKLRFILVLLLAAGTLVAAYVRINDGMDQTNSAKIQNGMLESEADRILANLGSDSGRWFR
jgi:hypothetical protein